MFEKTIRSKKIYKGRIISVKLDTVKLSNGVISKREIVEHPGAVAVIALTQDNKIILIRQFRKSAEQVMTEIPAGLVHKGERDIDGAKRELLEETGYKAKKLKKVFAGFSSPGFCTEIISFYLATGLTKAEQNCDEDEMIDVYFYPLKDALKMVMSGKIKDNKSIAGILYANLCKKQ
jgi:ADP-ribose pyrophosphatase